MATIEERMSRLLEAGTSATVTVGARKATGDVSGGPARMRREKRRAAKGARRQVRQQMRQVQTGGEDPETMDLRPKKGVRVTAYDISSIEQRMNQLLGESD